ncbi:hypothetical protein PoB_001030900 [Plakobranchus ocellatus]|uniref:Uncharacterized protein n=1 Tax=Plakobranchus ocellatus TaxID=259542 RepID=A0AAV3YLA9_9GAST|nr:hypothetical protein PoB_001030900 [Plakobranchus ocellatus]
MINTSTNDPARRQAHDATNKAKGYEAFVSREQCHYSNRPARSPRIRKQRVLMITPINGAITGRVRVMSQTLLPLSSLQLSYPGQ